MATFGLKIQQPSKSNGQRLQVVLTSMLGIASEQLGSAEIGNCGQCTETLRTVKKSEQLGSWKGGEMPVSTCIFFYISVPNMPKTNKWQCGSFETFGIFLK